MNCSDLTLNDCKMVVESMIHSLQLHIVISSFTTPSYNTWSQRYLDHYRLKLRWRCGSKAMVSSGTSVIMNPNETWYTWIQFSQCFPKTKTDPFVFENYIFCNLPICCPQWMDGIQTWATWTQSCFSCHFGNIYIHMHVQCVWGMWCMCMRLFSRMKMVSTKDCHLHLRRIEIVSSPCVIF